MTGDFTIREATQADAATVLLLFELAGLDQPGDHDRALAAAQWPRLQQAGASVLLACHEGLAIGTLTLFVLPLLAHGGLPAALVEDVAVHPSAQGLGVGRALMHEAMHRARAAGCYKLALSSNAVRVGAHAFYERLGFVRHGVSFSVSLTAQEPV
jgi:GNAT superfamily N-acetyltransferase